MENVKDVLKKLLKTSTGKQMCDSGDAYGRNWERNQEIDFDTEPRIRVDFYDGKADASDFVVSVYHYLSEILSLNEVCEEINELLSDDYYWSQGALEKVEEHFELQKASPTVNTCNHENFLSQVLQYNTFVYQDEVYVLLQIHQGCDVRGGYTGAYCFKLDGYLTATPDIYGYVDDVQVGTDYNGYSLTDDETNEEIEIDEDSDWFLDFYIMEETYMYME